MFLKKLVVISSLFAFMSTAAMANEPLAYLADAPHHYASLGIDQNETAIWEDGMRTDGREGSYEWWYTDAEFDDGTTVVVVFYTKNIFDVSGPAHPTAAINVNFPDGEALEYIIHGPKGQVLQAAKDHADVSIDESYIRYVDDHYELKFVIDDFVFEARMDSTLPMYRPASGHWFFGKKSEDYFAWFVAQPSSNITATLTRDGSVMELNGTGYHDHNWGNSPIHEGINHWYWARVKVGEYDAILVDLIAAEKYGYERVPIVMLAKDGEILKTNEHAPEIIRTNTRIHQGTGKFFDYTLTFIQQANDGVIYQIDLNAEQDLEVYSFLEALPWYQKILAKLAGENPTYLRVLGGATLTITDEDAVETFTHKGLWEQMFFGSNEHAIIGQQR
ncbi:MAG: hypothetical protein V3V13_02765 [Paracoccaceae bacterium]